MQYGSISTKGCGHIDLLWQVIGSTRRVDWEWEGFVDLGSDSRFEYKGDIVVIGMDMPEG